MRNPPIAGLQIIGSITQVVSHAGMAGMLLKLTGCFVRRNKGDINK